MLALLTPRTPQRSPAVTMKSVIGHRFSLDMWYGDDEGIGSKSKSTSYWVSPWAEAHHKLRKQEIEIEQCEFQLQHAVDNEDFEEAEGLRERVDRLKSQHPIIPREERLEEAVKEENFAMAAIFQRDLDQIKEGLGLPRYGLGQVVTHKYRNATNGGGLRGIVMNVELTCGKSRDWALEAGCLERGLALGIPPDECLVESLNDWVKQPFYTLLPDMSDVKKMPPELSAFSVNRFEKIPAPIYLPEDALTFYVKDEPIEHSQLSEHFGEYEYSQHRGRIYKATPKLRLWQRQQAEEELERAASRRKKGKIGTKVDGMNFIF